MPAPKQVARALDTLNRLGRTLRAQWSSDLIKLAEKINPAIKSFQTEWVIVEEQRWKDNHDDSLSTLWRRFASMRDREARDTWAFFHARSAAQSRSLFTEQIHLLFQIVPVEGDSRTIWLDPATGLRWVWSGRDKWRSIHDAKSIAEWEARDRALDELIGAAVRGADEDVLAPLRAALRPKKEMEVAA